MHIRSPQSFKYAAHWVQCCIILHNMIIRFEERLGKRSSMRWAQKESGEVERRGDNLVVKVPIGSPGQLFRAGLMNDLFEALGENYHIELEEA